ncbi:hypothetical protein [Aquimarina mytili]|uniref:DUF3999 domain-containing protein n=1 Tax=Aquimarina mytili TaxID=874423 RepID=A0A937A0Q1_9FLAO|nr:hypothetical protein [Aquimarina mytili]MBL0682880.1 hypothetical protein [Aquimarina mytili]
MIKSIRPLFLLLTGIISAQQPQIEGKLSEVKSDGLYKIKVLHDVRSYSKEDLSDFRIWDSKGEQVPYFVYPDDQETQISNFSEFEIISKVSLPDSITTYIFINPNDKINKAVLSIANYEGNKTYSLQGSNDQKQWFGLVNSQNLYAIKSTTATSVYKVIDFPLCSYKYLKLIFNDRTSLPINLLKIGTATTKILKSPLEEISVKNTSSAKLVKEKKTKIHVVFNAPEIINQLKFNISEPKLYNRKARIYTLRTREVKHQVETYEHHIANFTISSDQNIKFPPISFFEKEVYIEIENQDNPQLTFSSIQFFQIPVFVAADLKQGETYAITSGDKNLNKPNYDLKYFSAEISGNLPEARIISVKQNQDKDSIVEKPVPFWQKSWFMWACISIATLMIGYFAFSLLKDLKQENK